MGKRLFASTPEMESPSTPKSAAPKKLVHVGSVETSGDTWADIREAAKVHLHDKLPYHI